MDEKRPEMPSLEALKIELAREEARCELRKTFLHIAGVLVVSAAIAVLLLTRIFLLLHVEGMSMEPTVKTGEVVLLRQTKEIENGDLIGFYFEGRVLLKRAIGSAGDYIDIDQEGNVYVNSKMLEEPYLDRKGLGKCELDFPYQVPEGTIFVLGDNREVSLDSRIETIGCVKISQIVGKVACRVWPLARIGMVH